MPADGVTSISSSAFLGVERSLSGRAWRERPADLAVVREIQQRHGLIEPLAKALVSRGVTLEHAEHYLRPTLKALFPDPSLFTDMDRAAEILIDALERGRPTMVFADYDVDGATSAAQLVRWFRHMGVELPIYIPDRLTEGYGPSPAAFRKIRDGGAELVVTLDCGAAAYDAIASAGEIGLEVVVIDHHLMREDPPAAAAVVNPNRPGCPSGQGVLAAAGVTFVLLTALNREARKRGLFTEDRPQPDPRQWLDLVALGEVCDVTQLVGFNRALTALGLRAMGAWANPGLKALFEVGKGSGEPSVFTAGFILGPRINAGGRVGRSDLGARLLSTDDPLEARALAEELDSLNTERKAVEAAVVEEAAAMLERGSNFNPDAPVIVVAGDDWHPGVIGIVAGRLRERYRKPVVVIGIDRAANVGKGSGRSQPGVNLGRAIQAAFEAGLLMAGGGHAMAAGLSIRPEMIPEFRAFLEERLAGEMEAVGVEAVEVDALVQPRAANRALLDDFQRLAPFGPGNPEPLFALSQVRPERVSALKGGHVRMDLVGPTGDRIKAISWRSAETPLGQRLLAGGGPLDVVGKLKPDDYMGRNGVQFEIEDAHDPRARYAD
ncbi:single-stranded-DNA-specific exonuclease RecJ [Caulobacter vibrioides]|uniref:single-stranded-DNA-specific exonuclease RecJ n=1 Tax=Caulobacter vibrioides TaxID=155892 RepID=UPI000BB50BB6|nr:single-stranded-DNA-specific exonuclease RecJ [Caulobacter vibrioides]ATC24314.1 single-stranded-DNA-specific exonuclease RecJ [Caulobacter vibrioides]AZH12561.1 single-stranded-DNA-specific exonuclease RecJ [Caulobacter vibrioides]PLR14994.1 single-stranded-DNA-specific exonuclease RecJ [Caulobacter vibrioides]